MTSLEWLNLSISLAGLYLGFLGSRGELERIRRHRKLPRLIKEREFYEKLHASKDAQLAYLLEAILTVCAIAGGGLMFSAIDGLPPDSSPAFSVAIKWVVGGAIYMYSALKLGRYYRATTKYERTIALLNAEISKLEG